MRKRLLLLDLLLLALIAVFGARLRQNWLEARKRERIVLGQPLRPLPPPPHAPLPQIQPLNAAAYSEVAQQMLFSADRNPTVVVEVAPPPPMPALPVLYGVVNLGDGPTAIMSVKSGGQHQEVQAGQKVGEFSLVSLSSDEIVLEWQGKKVVKKITELVDRSSQAASAAPPETTPRAAGQSSGSAVSAPASRPAGPGVDMGAGLRACQPGDTSPPGTVSGGLKKVVSDSPFGKICRWEPAK